MFRVDLKANFVAFALSTLMIASMLIPVMAQGVTVGYTIQVEFYSRCICYLSNMQITVSDQSGRVIASGASPDGRMAIIPFRTVTPTQWIIVHTSGYANIAYYRIWQVSGLSIVPVNTAVDYYYVTIKVS